MMKRSLLSLAVAVAAVTFLSSTRTFAAEDALDEVNQTRAMRGLRPYVRDDNLTAGAKNVADYRAQRMCTGHTANDFAGLPPGVTAQASGCAAWAQGTGWGS